jgi:hypothetical protein
MMGRYSQAQIQPAYSIASRRILPARRIILGASVAVTSMLSGGTMEV